MIIKDDGLASIGWGMTDNVTENGYRLFGCGCLNDYGTYQLVVANSKEMAYEILGENGFRKWKKLIYEYKECSHFDENGNALNGCAENVLKNEEKGLYDMDDKTLFDYYKNFIFTKDKVIDLKTIIWDDEHA